MGDFENVRRTMKDFYKEYFEKNVGGGILNLEDNPEPKIFLRNYVMQNKPFFVNRPHSNSKDFNFALDSWKEDSYLSAKMQDKRVTVNVYPADRDNPDMKLGRDEVTDFVIPDPRKMPMSEFLPELRHAEYKGKFQVQKQNNLIEECYPLLQDVPGEISFASEAFGSPPKFVNIWINNKNTPTFLHNNEYEILFYVVTGCQLITIYPPICNSWMPYRKFRKFQWFYVEKDGIVLKRGWKKYDLNEEVTMIEPTKKPSTRENFIIYANHDSLSFTISIQAGQGLYIPALWFYEAQPSDRTISVNYWYDMKYLAKYPFYCLYNKVNNLPLPGQNVSTDIQPEFRDDLLKEALDRKKKRDQENAPKGPKKIMNPPWRR